MYDVHACVYAYVCVYACVCSLANFMFFNNFSLRLVFMLVKAQSSPYFCRELLKGVHPYHPQLGKSDKVHSDIAETGPLLRCPGSLSALVSVAEPATMAVLLTSQVRACGPCLYRTYLWLSEN